MTARDQLLDDRLESPAQRAQLLKTITPDDASSNHELLRSIFLAEMADRRADFEHPDYANDDPQNYFENLCWCAYLLSRVGDAGDVPMLWEAKNIDFDTYCAFDVQFLLGAGAEQTLALLRDQGHPEIAEELSQYLELIQHVESPEDRRTWDEWRREYFSGH